MSVPMPVPICRHVRPTGARCGSPALSGQPMCYHHNKLAHHHRHIAPQQYDDTPTVIHPISSSDRTQRDPLLAEYYQAQLLLDLPPLEDRESIQIALSMIITAMAQNRIDLKLATSMLYGLQVASSNVRNSPQQSPQNVVRSIVIENGQELAPDEDPDDPTTNPTLTRLFDHLQPEPSPEASATLTST